MEDESLNVPDSWLPISVSHEAELRRQFVEILEDLEAQRADISRRRITGFIWVQLLVVAVASVAWIAWRHSSEPSGNFYAWLLVGLGFFTYLFVQMFRYLAELGGLLAKFKGTFSKLQSLNVPLDASRY